MLLLASFVNGSFAQQEETRRDFERAKEKMRRKINAREEVDFTDVGAALEKYAIANPGNPEAWYFLGYAIDKFNALDGENIIHSNLLLAQKASECFQNALELSNGRYSGERLLLDPHSKILSVWGGQAMRYLYQHKTDSTAWCLQEARKRGGINPVMLKYFSQMLDECSDSAYLFTTGDLQVYYIAYLQYVLKARQDIRSINLDYLNTSWYAPLMVSSGKMELSMSPEVLNAISSRTWITKDVSIINSRYPAYGDSILTWQIKPSFDGTLLRSDFITLQLLQQNQMRDDVFFPSGLPVNQRLYLNTGNYLQLRGLTVKLNPYKNSNDVNYLRSRLPALEAIRKQDTVHLNNPDNLQMLNVVRFVHAWTAEYALQAGDTAYAKNCFIVAEQKYPEKLLPFFDDNDKKWYLELKEQVEKM